MSLWQFYFTFKGRISRSQFWLKGAPVFVGIYVLIYLIRNIIPVNQNKDILYFFIYPIILINSWSVLALMVKRIHDRNRSFWFPLEKYADLPKPNTLDYLFWGLIFIVSIILLFYMIVLWIWLFIIEAPLLKGTNGPNLYGPDPLNNENKQRIA